MNKNKRNYSNFLISSEFILNKKQKNEMSEKKIIPFIDLPQSLIEYSKKFGLDINNWDIKDQNIDLFDFKEIELKFQENFFVSDKNKNVNSNSLKLIEDSEKYKPFKKIVVIWNGIKKDQPLEFKRMSIKKTDNLIPTLSNEGYHNKSPSGGIETLRFYFKDDETKTLYPWPKGIKNKNEKKWNIEPMKDPFLNEFYSVSTKKIVDDEELFILDDKLPNILGTLSAFDSVFVRIKKKHESNKDNIKKNKLYAAFSIKIVEFIEYMIYKQNYPVLNQLYKFWSTKEILETSFRSYHMKKIILYVRDVLIQYILKDYIKKGKIIKTYTVQKDFPLYIASYINKGRTIFSGIDLYYKSKLYHRYKDSIIPRIVIYILLYEPIAPKLGANEYITIDDNKLLKVIKEFKPKLDYEDDAFFSITNSKKDIILNDDDRKRIKLKQKIRNFLKEMFPYSEYYDPHLELI